MAELKTRPSGKSVTAFLGSISDLRVRADCRRLSRIMREATGSRPRMWGASIVGFGSYRYQYASGRSGDWFLTGYSPRQRELTVYLMNGVEAQTDLLRTLGRFRTGRGCLYLRSLDDVHLPTLEKLIRRSVRETSRTSA